MVVLNFLNNIDFSKYRGTAWFDKNKLLLKTDDLGLIQSSRELGAADAKLYQIDIDGANGIIDLSDYESNDVFFKNATDTYTYTLTGTATERKNILNNIYAELHGKYLYMIDCDFSDRYSIGRVSINIAHNKGYSELKIQFNREPYRLKAPISKEIFTDLPSAVTLEFENGRKQVLPMFTADGEHSVIFEGETYIINDGAERITVPDIVFKRGTNRLTIIKTNPDESAAYTWGDVVGTVTVGEICENYNGLLEVSDLIITRLCGGKTWAEIVEKKIKWCNLHYLIGETDKDKKSFKIDYEWGEL